MAKPKKLCQAALERCRPRLGSVRILGASRSADELHEPDSEDAYDEPEDGELEHHERHPGERDHQAGRDLKRDR